MIPVAVSAPATDPPPAVGVSGQIQRIVCLAPLDREHGVREAVWAADILRFLFPDLHLFVVGAGSFRPELEGFIAALGNTNIHLLGDEVPPLQALAGAHVCWVPSRADTGRRAALEAMAHGKAIVASDVACLRELIRDNRNGCLVPPGDPVPLAKRTRALLLDAELRERLGAAARTHVLAQFSPQHIAARWLELYDDVKTRRAA
jgi:glycosyltransferase involved in cell wall biosynthesis